MQSRNELFLLSGSLPKGGNRTLTSEDTRPTATLMSRAKEISIQKILGASKIYLIVYFWIESIFVCVIALLLSYGLIAIALPHFNTTTGKNNSLLQSQWIWAPSLIIAMLIALLAGVVPAIQSIRINLVKKTTAYGRLINTSSVRTAYQDKRT
jgi:putative ABC transport system permease protein